MVVGASLSEVLRARIGVIDSQRLGMLTESLIRRYARAIGEDDPLHHDVEHARAAGLPGVLAPPNLIPSIVCWNEGAPDSALRTDGTEAGTHLPGVPSSGVRVMGGGEEMQFHAPAHAGMELNLDTQLESVEERDSKTGAMLILRYRNDYTTVEGDPILTTYRTVLLR